MSEDNLGITQDSPDEINNQYTVNQDTHQTQPIETELITPPIEVTFPRRSSIYYSITESEINSYATFGWLATIFLTFFGAFAGFAFGGLVALQQPNLPGSVTSTLSALTWTTGIVSILFIILAVVSIVIQAKNKKAWE